jgi:hypothetical protein
MMIIVKKEINNSRRRKKKDEEEEEEEEGVSLPSFLESLDLRFKFFHLSLAIGLELSLLLLQSISDQQQSMQDLQNWSILANKHKVCEGKERKQKKNSQNILLLEFPARQAWLSLSRS